MAKGVLITADTIRTRRKLGRIAKISLLILLLFLIVVYIILQVIYSEGKFTITLDPNEELNSGLMMYETLNDPTPKRQLVADAVQFMDNISIKWLPDDINGDYEGSHNGDNYIAYTFYLSNGGKSAVHYWYEVDINDSVKNVDEAVRFMIIHNGTKKVYAKRNKTTLEPEDGTISFVDEKIAILEQRKNFKPGEVDKFTIVMWIEGDDPDCLNDLLGGEIKFGMNIFEESYKSGVKNEKK